MAIIFGTIGDDIGVDRIIGTDLDDVIFGLGGNDEIQDNAGNDVAHGGAGDDTFIQSTGVDTFNGGDGIDTLTVDGSGIEPRSIELVTNLTLGRQYATIQDPSEWDRLISIENWIMTAGDINTTLTGTIGDNTLTTQDGDDVLNGLAGNDTLSDGAGNDIINGGAGDDTFIVNTGIDTYNGGEGNDTMIVDLSGATPKSFELTADLGAGLQYGNTQDPSEYDTITGMENYIMLGGDIDATISGTGAANTLTSFDGDDLLNGLGGNDVLSADSGDDTINGGDGDDVIYDGNGSDTVDGGSGNDTIYSEGGVNDSYDGGDGIDTLIDDLSSFAPDIFVVLVDMEAQTHGADTQLPDGLDTMINIENYTLIGGQSSEVIGDANANVLTTDAGNDTVSGNGGRDIISTGAGTDVLDGGAGLDYLNGGADADVFQFDTGSGIDIIQDFEDDIDTLAFGEDLSSTYGTNIEDEFIYFGNIAFANFGNGDILIVVSDGMRGFLADDISIVGV